MFWEVAELADGWEFLSTAPSSDDALWRTADSILVGKMAMGDLRQRQLKAARRFKGMSAWGKRGVASQPDAKLACDALYRRNFRQERRRHCSEDESTSSRNLGFLLFAEFREAVREIDQKLNVTQRDIGQSPLRPRALAEGGGGEISARIAEAVFQRPDAVAVQRPSQRFGPAVARGRGAVARLPVAAPDRFQFSRLPGARPGWSGKAGG